MDVRIMELSRSILQCRWQNMNQEVLYMAVSLLRTVYVWTITTMCYGITVFYDATR
jgi:hypothetical protein